MREVERWSLELQRHNAEEPLLSAPPRDKNSAPVLFSSEGLEPMQLCPGEGLSSNGRVPMPEFSVTVDGG